MKAKLTVYCYQHPEDADAPLFVPGGDRADPGSWVIEDPWDPNLHHVVAGNPPFEFDPPRTRVEEGIDRGHIRDELMEWQREAPTHPEIGVQEGITMADVDSLVSAMAKPDKPENIRAAWVQAKSGENTAPPRRGRGPSRSGEAGEGGER